MSKGSSLNLLNARVQRAAVATGNDDIFDVTPPAGLQASDQIDGSGGNDTLRLTAAGTMDITLPGSFVNMEILRGSTGDDIFIVSNQRLAGITTIDGSTGNDKIQLASTQNDLNLQTIILTGIEHILGNALDNAIDGAASDDTIDGGEGSDILSGRGGADNLTGGLGDDTLYGGAGDDQLTGADNTEGEDVLIGGAGNDTYFVDGADDWINEIDDGGAGIDTISANETSYDLRNAQVRGDVENLTLTGNRNANGFGTRLDNTIIGNGGNNKLYGFEGNDRLSGGGGADRLEGGAGDDRLDGGAGNDVLLGGDGNDTYVVDSLTDIVDERVSTGTRPAPRATVNNDVIEASLTYSLTGNTSILGVVEHLTLTGNTAIDGTGNELDNILTGNSGNNRLYGLLGNDRLFGNAGADTLDGDDGNDTLDGGAGADTMIGGDGDDIYIVDDAGDMVDESTSSGMDTIRSSVTYSMVRQAGSLPQGSIEKLELTGTANIDGTGNGLANIITGNSGNNTLDGGAGADRLDGGGGTDILRGGRGNDTYVIDSYTDTLDESGGRPSDIDTIEIAMNISLANGSTQSPTIRGNIEGIKLTGTAALNATGNGLNNQLTGNLAANQLDGGLGNDTLTGGKGADVFIFSTALNATTNVDKITDFSDVEDTIRLDDGIFTAIGAPGLLAATAFTANVTGTATTTAHRIIYETDTGKLFYDADGSGNGAAIQFAEIAPNLRTLSIRDFVIF